MRNLIVLVFICLSFYCNAQRVYSHIYILNKSTLESSKLYVDSTHYIQLSVQAADESHLITVSIRHEGLFIGENIITMLVKDFRLLPNGLAPFKVSKGFPPGAVSISANVTNARTTDFVWLTLVSAGPSNTISLIELSKKDAKVNVYNLHGIQVKSGNQDDYVKDLPFGTYIYIAETKDGQQYRGKFNINF
ncbi:MAG TPA: hypothetical protein VF691_20970 [Cytophagaceae bacterium]|jgi:hypothetical protein